MYRLVTSLVERVEPSRERARLHVLIPSCCAATGLHSVFPTTLLSSGSENWSSVLSSARHTEKSTKGSMMESVASTLLSSLQVTVSPPIRHDWRPRLRHQNAPFLIKKQFMPCFMLLPTLYASTGDLLFYLRFWAAVRPVPQYLLAKVAKGIKGYCKV